MSSKEQRSGLCRPGLAPAQQAFLDALEGVYKPGSLWTRAGRGRCAELGGPAGRKHLLGLARNLYVGVVLRE
jgi:hypothetical protein